MRFSVSDMCQTALLAAFIAVSGSFKIPSLIPGSEFQLSAPVAVAACGIFGIKKYLTAGIAASAICLILGTQNVFNVLIALSFRAVIAVMFAFMGSSKAFYIIAGPVASALSRLVLALFVDKAVYALIAAAVPGMICVRPNAPTGERAPIWKRLSCQISACRRQRHCTSERPARLTPGKLWV